MLPVTIWSTTPCFVELRAAFKRKDGLWPSLAGVLGEITLIIARLGAFQTSTAHPSPLMEASRQPQTDSVWSLTEPNQN